MPVDNGPTPEENAGERERIQRELDARAPNQRVS
jgi:hypothetical protein